MRWQARRTTGAVALLALLLLAAGCSGSSPVTARLSLATTRVTAGATISGSLVVDNPGDPIDLTKVATGPPIRRNGTTSTRLTGCMPHIAVALSREGFRQEPAFAFDCSPKAFTVAHGVTRIPVLVFTTYLACLQPGGTSINPGTPRCLAGNRPPPLPAGRYVATVVWSETVPLPAPPPVSVTILG